MLYLSVLFRFAVCSVLVVRLLCCPVCIVCFELFLIGVCIRVNLLLFGYIVVGFGGTALMICLYI